MTPRCLKLLTGLLCALLPWAAQAQSATDMAVLKGLAPLAVLSKTPAGAAALAANFAVTGAIQSGALTQSILLPFPQQQQQALQDAFITFGDLAQLADGLGTTLGSGYVARAHYLDWTHFTSVSQPVAALIAYAESTAEPNAGAAKWFFANATTDGRTPVSPVAAAILQEVGGVTDIFGKSYHLPAGAAGADAFGNSRPFQTEPHIVSIVGPDYLNTPADNEMYNRGPVMELSNSPSFPSGHTTYGYTGALLLALMVPARYPQMVTRGAEYGNDRILMGAHYAMDVIGGRTLALYDMAHLLANDPAYVGRTLGRGPVIRDFPAALTVARTAVTAALQAACGKTVEDCATEDTGRFRKADANEAFYADTQTYGLPVVYPQVAAAVEDVGKLAPEAGHLLTAAFPSLTLEQADQILTETEGPGGGFLDNGSSFGVYSRINLQAAAVAAKTLIFDHEGSPHVR